MFNEYRAKELAEVGTIGNTAKLKVMGDNGSSKWLTITTTELERIIAVLEPKDYARYVHPELRVEFPELSVYSWERLTPADGGQGGLYIERTDGKDYWPYEVIMFRREAWKVKSTSGGNVLGRVYFETTTVGLALFEVEIEGQPKGAFDSLEHAVKFIINTVDGYGTED